MRVALAILAALMVGSLAMALWPARAPQRVAVDQAHRPRPAAPIWCADLGCSPAIEARERATAALDRALRAYPPPGWWRRAWRRIWRGVL